MLEKMQKITHELTCIARDLEVILSKDHVSFDIQFGDESYSFHPVSSMDEKEEMDFKRRKLINELILDAVSTFIKLGLFNNEPQEMGENFEFSWGRILEFKIPSVESTQSPIDIASYEEFKRSANDYMKSINMHTYCGVMERSDLTDEQRYDKLKELAEKGCSDAA